MLSSRQSERKWAAVAQPDTDILSSSYTGKRVLDLTLVLLALPIALPLIVFLACLVALDGSKPFFVQTRIGRNGRCFQMIKLRTMLPDAEQLLTGLLERDPSRRQEWRRYQKLENDPRITKLGRVLRRSSLDELPQILNVLLGDMSLVGPRPMMPDQVQHYPGSAYFSLRPGITGPWQIADRNSVSFATRAKFDQSYMEHQSIWRDLYYLTLTVFVVARFSGK